MKKIFFFFIYSIYFWHETFSDYSLNYFIHYKLWNPNPFFFEYAFEHQHKHFYTLFKFYGKQVVFGRFPIDQSLTCMD